MMSSQEEYIEKLRIFNRIPHPSALQKHKGKPAPHSFPRVNEQNHKGKQRVIKCDTRNALQAVYGPLNEDLYALIDAHHQV